MLAITAALLAAVLGGRETPQDATAIAEAVEAAVGESGPVEGTTEAETVALLLVTADEESGFRMDVVGDAGRAICAMQVWGPRERLGSVDGCVKAALAAMREGRRLCPSEPLASYAGGCNRPAARRISAWRRARARRAVASLAAAIIH